SSSRRLLDDIRMRARQSADTVQHNSTMLRRHFDQLGATGLVIEEITSSFVETAGRIESMSAAAMEQRRRLDDVATGIDHIDTAAADLTSATKALLQQVERIFDSHQELRIVLESSTHRASAN
ncbi:MAG: hypothetical protein MUC50_22250, partial [Myxococcota bacterium]|nr:hypothetical protein [Myxococcota bacterium]